MVAAAACMAGVVLVVQVSAMSTYSHDPGA